MFLKTSKDTDQELPESFWREHVEGYRGSGLSKNKYCEANGLKYSKFLYWCSKLTNNTNNLLLPVKLELADTKSLCALELKDGHRLLIYDESLLPKLISWLNK